MTKLQAVSLERVRRVWRRQVVYCGMSQPYRSDLRTVVVASSDVEARDLRFC